MLRRLSASPAASLGAALAASLAALLLAAAAAAPAPPEVRVAGAYCTPAGCGAPGGATRSSALGFAAAVLAAGTLARRRTHGHR